MIAYHLGSRDVTLHCELRYDFLGACYLPPSFRLTEEEYDFVLTYRNHLWDLLCFTLSECAKSKLSQRLAYSVAYCLGAVIQGELHAMTGLPTTRCRCRHGPKFFLGSTRRRHSPLCFGDCQNLWEGEASSNILDLVKVSNPVEKPTLHAELFRKFKIHRRGA